MGYRAKTSYDIRRRKRLPAKVISIGNITTGGTGKTPATIAIAEEALRRGMSPCILTRGYKGGIKNTCIVSPDMSVRDAGDEPLLMSSKLDEVSIIKDPDRYRGGMYALEALDKRPDLFILDDGFQHRRLYRDVDVLLINARNPFDNGRLLPMGLLREPLGQMKRADFIVITKNDGKGGEALIKQIREHNSTAPLYMAEHSPAYVQTFKGERLSIDWLEGKRVLAFCGIAEPGSFKEALRRKGAQISGYREYRDHFNYSIEDFNGIQQEARKCGAEWIITTEKDIMRLKDYDIPDNLLVLGIDFKVESDFYGQVFDKALV
jgi:tetraacyldisaccharide 4'-kinase